MGTVAGGGLDFSSGGGEQARDQPDHGPACTREGSVRRSVGPSARSVGLLGYERTDAAGEARPGLGRFVPPLIHFAPYLLTYSVPLFLQRQCDRILGTPRCR